MPSKQRKFTLIQPPSPKPIPQAPPGRILTSKQVEKIYRQSKRGPRRSRAQQREYELREQERIRRELAEQDKQDRAREREAKKQKGKSLKERQKAKEDERKREMRRLGLPTEACTSSQHTLSEFWRGNGGGRKRDEGGGELSEKAEKAEKIGDEMTSDAATESAHESAVEPVEAESTTEIADEEAQAEAPEAIEEQEQDVNQARESPVRRVAFAQTPPAHKAREHASQVKPRARTPRVTFVEPPRFSKPSQPPPAKRRRLSPPPDLNIDSDSPNEVEPLGKTVPRSPDLAPLSTQAWVSANIDILVPSSSQEDFVPLTPDDRPGDDEGEKDMSVEVEREESVVLAFCTQDVDMTTQDWLEIQCSAEMMSEAEEKEPGHEDTGHDLHAVIIPSSIDFFEEEDSPPKNYTPQPAGTAELAFSQVSLDFDVVEDSDIEAFGHMTSVKHNQPGEQSTPNHTPQNPPPSNQDVQHDDTFKSPNPSAGDPEADSQNGRKPFFVGDASTARAMLRSVDTAKSEEQRRWDARRVEAGRLAKQKRDEEIEREKRERLDRQQREEAEKEKQARQQRRAAWQRQSQELPATVVPKNGAMASDMPHVSTQETDYGDWGLDDVQLSDDALQALEMMFDEDDEDF